MSVTVSLSDPLNVTLIVLVLLVALLVIRGLVIAIRGPRRRRTLAELVNPDRYGPQYNHDYADEPRRAHPRRATAKPRRERLERPQAKRRPATLNNPSGQRPRGKRPRS